MQKQQLICRKPAYRRGQLLLEDDFINEQRFHLQARYAHAREMHGFGVVHGLELARTGEQSISVSPGYAIDRRGHEIELKRGETLELGGFQPGSRVHILLGHRTERMDTEAASFDCYAVVRAATSFEGDDVRLGSVDLDSNARVAQGVVFTDPRDRLTLAADSVTAEALAPSLRRNWLTMAFHPSALPEDEPGWKPPFRVGATRVLAHREYNGQQDPGAAGSMAIVLPPGIGHLHRFRVAGEFNDKTLSVELIKGGFNESTGEHHRDLVVSKKVPKGSYFVTLDIPANHGRWDDPTRTLSVEIRCEGYASVSLVAIDVSY